MTRLNELTPQFVERTDAGGLPELGVIWISRSQGYACYECPCGCGSHVGFTFGTPTGWVLKEEDGKITVDPSILHMKCGAHYYIRQNRVEWC